MPTYTGEWDRTEVAAFLADATVPVRLACRTPAGGLWMLSLWYRFDADAERLVCATAAEADVVEYLRADDEVTFEVSTNDPPYRGVRGNGQATITPDDDKAVLRSLLERYLGGTDSALARRLLAPERDEVAIRIDPARLYSWDFTERMREVSDV
ncbi:pyridoxamine 5'-phosphate oxidase family protein [Haloplanus aerogenes]|uniref:Pyridoxamine 5'-phosphate oxidase family protein n=1 Tax=Haloplanus aerogenes TaxID=660522 RepID=A0A3M0E7T3_9EURY|nr:pyridoxamine 5'-phosphate oxidase family protein [Haloplanus aerogenes]AZH24378.1 pyridoxamine 5'-phosphate oxidase family protein [Haloplanus aerogenes]RMB23983.1 pyridoxamine 5'-phosphate oxidase-like protein [Haloplanus aerogenes]